MALAAVAAGYCAYVYVIKPYDDTAIIASFTKAIREDLRTGASIRTLNSKYDAILERFGASRGQDILVAAIPEGGVKLHLVNHQSGKFLYETEGAAGITGCKPYAVGSCYHGFIIAMTADLGLGHIGDLVSACKKALTSEDVHDCAHGAGHAFLIEENYDYSQAMASCRSSFSDIRLDLEFCYNGVSMENTFGTLSETGQPGHSFKPTDPMYPCDMSAIMADAQAHRSCWITQSLSILTPLYTSINGDIPKAATYCDSLGRSSNPYALTDVASCYRALGAQIYFRGHNDVTEMRDLCSELRPEKRDSCLWFGAGYAYHYGNEVLPFQVCESEEDSERMSACYLEIDKAIGLRYSETPQRIEACLAIPVNYRQTCLQWVTGPDVDTPYKEIP